MNDRTASQRIAKTTQLGPEDSFSYQRTCLDYTGYLMPLERNFAPFGGSLHSWGGNGEEAKEEKLRTFLGPRLPFPLCELRQAT